MIWKSVVRLENLYWLINNKCFIIHLQHLFLFLLLCSYLGSSTSNFTIIPASFFFAESLIILFFYNSLSPSCLNASYTFSPVFALVYENIVIPLLSINPLTSYSSTRSSTISIILANSMISQPGYLYLLTSYIQNSVS